MIRRREEAIFIPGADGGNEAVMLPCIICGKLYDGTVYNWQTSKFCPEHQHISRLKRGHHRRAPGNFSGEEWYWLVERTGRKCVICGEPGDERTLCADHIIPVSKGGLNVISNIQPLCQFCNSSKHDKILP